MSKAAELAKMGEVLTNSQIGRKNIIINGAMQIAQRATSASGKGDADGYFTVDRFKMVHNATSAGRYTMSQSSVTDLEGFSNAVKIDCTTADTSIAASEVLILGQKIEGFNAQQLKASSTSTRAMTLSFYAKSNASRAIATELRFSNGTNRQASKLHTIGTSWARYTFTVPASSSMQIDNDNSDEMQINFFLHAGSTYTSGTLSATFEASNNANRAAGIGSIFASTDNTLEITGLQFELGSQATPFEHISRHENFINCQRYYQIVPKYTFMLAVEVGTESVRGGLTLPTPMRASPTIGSHNLTRYDDDDNTFSNKTPVVFANSEAATDQAPDVDGKMGILSLAYNSIMSGGTDNHNVTTLFGTAMTLDAEL